ncbi:MAG: hypothetical protein AMJ46_06500 [Latescibacteria bacterium DG_63]|nr:MAG: hypothetical protein AMJ46_06500 [Latescibacteria bacterium DG_63]
MNLRFRLRIGWIAMGFTSMVAQVTLMRELMVVFYGNEISLGVVLANWLLWTGVGSFGLGRYVDRLKRRLPLLVLCFVLLSLLLPALIVGVRGARLLWGISPGEIVGFAPMFYASFLLVAPICILCGFLFALNCRILDLRLRDAVTQVGRVYIFDATGAALGGVLFSYVMIQNLSHFEIAAVVGVIDCAVALLLALKENRLLSWMSGFILVLFAAFSWLWVGELEQRSNRLRWGDLELLRSKESVYGNIAVISRLDQRSFYENGLLMFSSPDIFSAEEAVQFTLLEHPNPNTVLLLGGGVANCVQEILKHEVSHVDYVELDPQIVQLAREFLPFNHALEDPRVTIIHMDGRFFVKTTKSTYDCVILNLPDPFTAQLNRFYTVEFFEEVRRILNPHGIFSFRVTSAENYIGDELGDFLSSARGTLRKVFPETVVIPGESNIFIAANTPHLLTLEPDTLIKRLRERGVATTYVREYYLPYRMSSKRAEYLLGRIEESRKSTNSDFRPISYYYNIVLWSTYFHTPIRRVLSALSHIQLWHVLLVVAALAFLALPLSIRYRSLPVLLGVATTGSAEIIMEVVCMLAFQVLYGFVYSRIGLITASFMAGLTSGGLLMVSIQKKRDLTLSHFGLLQTAVCIYPLLLVASFQLFSRAVSPSTLFFIEVLFPFLTFFAGFIGGLQFPLANKLSLFREKEVGMVAGKIYGIDLFGSCIGALFASSVLIPILGIFETCYVVVAFNLVSVVVIAASLRRQSRVG